MMHLHAVSICATFVAEISDCQFSQAPSSPTSPASVRRVTVAVECGSRLRDMCVLVLPEDISFCVRRLAELHTSQPRIRTLKWILFIYTLCMYVCMYVFVCVCVVCMCLCVCVCIYIYIYIYIHIYMHKHIYMYVYAKICVCIDVECLCFVISSVIHQLSICTCIHVSICVHAYSRRMSQHLLQATIYFF